MNRVANLDGHVGEYGMLVQMEVCFYVSGAWPLILAERALVRNVAMQVNLMFQHFSSFTCDKF